MNTDFPALCGAENAQALDREALEWGLNEFSLVEAAGRICADFFRTLPPHNEKAGSGTAIFPFAAVLAGSGNNAADALVMLRTLIINQYFDPSGVRIFCTKFPQELPVRTPLSNALVAVQRLGVSINKWNVDSKEFLIQADIIIDGIAGTGQKGPLHGTAAEMVDTVNCVKAAGKQPRVISIDVPSGNFDGWKPGMPVINADSTLAIEPAKLCLYNPASRPSAGQIISVRGIFPPELIEKYREASLRDWKNCCQGIAPLKPDAYKYQRGVAEIWAGSSESAGAAMLAARGAQAAGAGLVRLIVDPSIYAVLAPNSGGIMVTAQADSPVSAAGCADSTAARRFTPDAILAGPGWGRGEDRSRLLEKFLQAEAQGCPLILDADAIALARDICFNGNTLITPHPAEFAAYTGLPVQEILANPAPILRQYAAQKNVHILLKGHVLYIASPPRPGTDPTVKSKLSVLDGMNPALAVGGTGDVLAGFCAAIAGRMAAENSLNLHECAVVSASLLLEAGMTANIRKKFIDPLELARSAADIAGGVWLINGRNA